MKDFRNSPLLLTAAGLLIPVLATVAARKATGKGYHAITRSDPPRNPAHPDVEWKEAIVWTVTSGMIAGLARLGVRRWLAETKLPTD